jgi:hypothetical protein
MNSETGSEGAQTPESARYRGAKITFNASLPIGRKS